MELDHYLKVRAGASGAAPMIQPSFASYGHSHSQTQPEWRRTHLMPMLVIPFLFFFWFGADCVVPVTCEDVCSPGDCVGAHRCVRRACKAPKVFISFTPPPPPGCTVHPHAPFIAHPVVRVETLHMPSLNESPICCVACCQGATLKCTSGSMFSIRRRRSGGPSGLTAHRRRPRANRCRFMRRWRP